MVRTILLGPIVPVALSLSGPVYSAYNKEPYSYVVAWALFCTVVFIWRSRPSIQYAIESERSEGQWTPWLAPRLVVMVGVQMALAFLAGHSALYFLVKQFSN